MTSAIARGLAVAAALAALMTTAACGGGETTQQEAAETTKADETPNVDEEEESASDSEEDTNAGEGHGELFPGSDTEEPSASAITLPSTEVGEETSGSVEIRGEKTGPTLQNIAINIDGKNIPSGRQCLGGMQPVNCTLTFPYTPTQPGPYTGELTATMSDGSTVTAPIYGEAVEEAASTPQTPDEPETEEWSPEESTDVTSPEDLDLP